MTNTELALAVLALLDMQTRVEFPIHAVGGATAPPTLCSAPPTFVRFDRFLASKRTFFTAGLQSYRIRRPFGT